LTVGATQEQASIVNKKRMETAVNKFLKRENIWVIEILLTQLEHDLKVYLLFLKGATDKPFIKNNKLCFFTKNRIIEKLSVMGITILPHDFDDEIELTCDINKVLRLITLNSIDKDATLINFMNIFFDIINALNIVIPNEYKNVLYLIADHLTFNRRFGSFLKQNKLSREDIINAIYWLNGAIISNSQFVY
jgi:hypothetical protein